MLTYIRLIHSLISKVGRYFLSVSSILIVMFSLNSCTLSPKYKTVKRYIKPDSNAGNDCLVSIKNTRLSCSTRADAEYDVCISNAKLDAQKPYRDALDAYEIKKKEAKENENENKQKLELLQNQKKLNNSNCRKDYKKEMSKYELEYQQWSDRHRGKPHAELLKPFKPISTCSASISNNSSNKYTDIKEGLDVFFLGMEKPTLSDYIYTNHCNEMKKKCDRNYDENYLSCGGIVNETTKCVENCPD